MGLAPSKCIFLSSILPIDTLDDASEHAAKAKYIAQIFPYSVEPYQWSEPKDAEDVNRFEVDEAVVHILFCLPSFLNLQNPARLSMAVLFCLT